VFVFSSYFLVTLLLMKVKTSLVMRLTQLLRVVDIFSEVLVIRHVCKMLAALENRLGCSSNVIIIFATYFFFRYTIYSPKDGQPCMDHDRQTGEVITCDVEYLL
jgi:hypothetical protein